MVRALTPVQPQGIAAIGMNAGHAVGGAAAQIERIGQHFGHVDDGDQSLLRGLTRVVVQGDSLRDRCLESPGTGDPTANLAVVAAEFSRFGSGNIDLVGPRALPGGAGHRPAP